MFKIISRKEYLMIQHQLTALEGNNCNLDDRLRKLERDQTIIQKDENCATGPWCRCCENGYSYVDQCGDLFTQCTNNVPCKDFVKLKGRYLYDKQ